jgi:hypothetical protein
MSCLTSRVYLEHGNSAAVVIPHCTRRAPDSTGD